MFTLATVSSITSVTMTRNSATLVLALAALSGAIEIGSFLFYVALPKVAEASVVVTVACGYLLQFC
jgi:hypothetical protein